MAIYPTNATGEIISNLLLVSILLFSLGLASAILLWRQGNLCKKASLGFSLLASLSLFVAGIFALLGLQINPVIFATVSQLGSFGFGIDALSGFFAVLIGFAGISISIYSFTYLEEYQRKGYSIAKFAFLFNLFLLSMAAVVSAQNAFAFLVFWELMALSSYYLVSFEHKEEASKNAGFVYLLMTHFGTACLIVMYLILAGGAGGSFDFSAFSNATYLSIAKDAIFVLALVGFGVKAGLMPFHIWLPIAHPKAPSNISALMSGIMLKTAIYGMVRVIFGFLAVGITSPPIWWGIALLGLGIISAVLGALYSMMEHDLKILLAYSSIENIGIIAIGLGASLMFLASGLQAVAALALFAALYHSLNHSLFKNLLFAGAGSIMRSTHSGDIDNLGGLNKKMPMTASLFFVGAASIAAIPPLNGFVSEWLTFIALLGGIGASATVSFSSAMAVIFLALTSGLAVAVFVKAFGVTFLGTPRSENVESAQDPPKGMLFGMGLLASACIALGLFPGVIAQVFVPVLTQLKFSGATEIVATANTLPTLWIFAALFVIMALLTIFLRLIQRKRTVSDSSSIATWDCGVPSIDGNMQYTAKGFSMPVIRTFGFAVGPLGKGNAYGHQLFEAVIYHPLETLFLTVSPWSRKLHTGKLMHYLLYLLVTLIAVISFALIR
ncbi:MAG: hydrogenase 4 subunit B [Candidatus Micrarchaeota archaeon]|nr:hydrogenase 4 subunit B [Candidatus Micrarchaeota archaeon]